VTVVNLLAPIFLVIALGAALQKGGLLTRELVTGLSRLLYWVCIPIAVFEAMTRAELRGAGVGPLLLVVAGATLITAAITWWSGPWLGVFPAGRGTYTQASFRGNLSFVALPLLLTVPGIPLGEAMLVFAPMVILHNALSVAVLAVNRGGVERSQIGWQVVAEIGRNPIIIAALTGLVWGFAGGSRDTWFFFIHS